MLCLTLAAFGVLLWQYLGGASGGDGISLLAADDRKITVTDVDDTDFPSIRISVDCESFEDVISADAFSVTEDNADMDIQTVEIDRDRVTITYTAADAGDAAGEREVAVRYKDDRGGMKATGQFTAPAAVAVDLRLTQVDVSDYPVIRAYYRAEDPATNESVYGLSQSSFVIREKTTSGEFISREVRSVLQLEGNAGVNIELVADISGSIETADLQQIQLVMTDFINTLQYEAGDLAEILAFDTEVYEMCPFTNDVSLLLRGIGNMYSSGRTALYDAVIASVNRVMQQSGARCCIAFTDGQDNSSTTSLSVLIEYAVDCKVPIFIIGVGSDLDESSLKMLAENTGGAYWNINDLQDLEEIYQSIYQEQKDLYMVEYETTLALSDVHCVNIVLQNGLYRAQTEDEFVPAVVAADNAGVSVGQTMSAYSNIDMTEIDSIIAASVSNASKFSFYLKDLNSGMTIGTANGKTQMSASALINIPILFTISEGVTSGSIRMDDKIRFSYTYTGGRGKLKESDDGSYFTIEELVYYMLAYSDNNATNSLLNYLGINDVNRVCNTYDFLTIDLNRLLLPGTQSVDNYASACDLVTMLDVINSDTFGLGSAFLKDYFHIVDSVADSGLGKYIPASASFLNHNAVTTSTYNEIAIISGDGASYIIGVMSCDGKWAEAAEAAALISDYVYDCMTR